MKALDTILNIFAIGGIATVMTGKAIGSNQLTATGLIVVFVVFAAGIVQYIVERVAK